MRGLARSNVLEMINLGMQVENFGISRFVENGIQELAVLIQQGALDLSGLFQHKRERGSRVLNFLFALFRQTSPGHAIAVYQPGPVGLF